MLHQVQVQRRVRKMDAQDELDEAVRNAHERGAVVENSARVHAAVVALLEAIEASLED